MTRAQLEERIAKAIEKIEKKESSIAKKQIQIEKKIDQLSKLGFTYIEGTRVYGNELEQQGFNRETAYDIYWLQCDIEHLKDDIKRNSKEIPEIHNTIEKYKKQLAGEIEKEHILTTEMPQQFTDLQTELVNRWDAWDINRRQFVTEKYKELGYREFFQKYSSVDYNLIHTSNEDIHKANLKNSELMIIDLYNRIKEITGEVTDWCGIRAEMGNSFPVLTGVVTGKLGKASVETILAGGYNIQKLHIRTLVHSII